MSLDVAYHRRRMAERLQDPEFRREYDAARDTIDQIDAVVRALDRLRMDTGLTKAELARRIGKNPAAVRRLFSAAANPELGTVVAIAGVLNAEIKVVPKEPAPDVTRRRSHRASIVA